MPVFWWAMVIPGWSNVLLDSQPRFEELTNLIRTIRNAMKIRDVTKCLEEFELLGKAYGKAKSIVDKEGVPRFYVRILADLEDYLNEVCCLWVGGGGRGAWGPGLLPAHLQGPRFLWVVCLPYSVSQNTGSRNGARRIVLAENLITFISILPLICGFVLF